MLNLLVIFTFSVLDRKYRFWVYWPQNDNRLFKMKVGIQTNSNISNLIVLFIWAAFDGNYSLSENLVSRQFEYPKFDVGVQIFSFGLEISFMGKFSQKIQNCLFKVKFGT